jgi:hypothetical protein
LLITPVPEHFLHGLDIILPLPPHVLHVLSIVKKPWLLLTFPLPPHVWQVLISELPPSAPVPEHESHLAGALIFIVFSNPV